MLIIVSKKLQTNKVSSTKTTKNQHKIIKSKKLSFWHLCLWFTSSNGENPPPEPSSTPLSFLLLRLEFGPRFPCSVLQRLSKWGPLVLSGSSALFWGGLPVYLQKYRSLGHPDTKLIQNNCSCTSLAQSGSPRALRHLTWSCVLPRSAYSFSADCAFINPFMVGWCQINSCSSWSSWVYLGTQSHSAHEALVQCLVPTEWVYHLIDELRTRW